MFCCNLLVAACRLATCMLQVASCIAVVIGVLQRWDFTLIVAENTDVSAEDETRNVLLWSDNNKLSVNLSKCKEIVFRRPSVKLDILPDPLADVERVSCANLLGVFIDCRLKFTEHVEYVIKISNQRLYLTD